MGELTIGLAGSRYLLREDRHELVWAAFLDAMQTLRRRLPQPPPYRFCYADLSTVDRYLAERLTASGRHVTALPLDPALDRGYAIWTLNDQLARDADGLVAIWDARVHEALFVLHAARGHHKPFEVRILNDGRTTEQLVANHPGSWRAISSDDLDLHDIPQPRRAPTPDEAVGTSYDLYDDQHTIYRSGRPPGT